MSDRSISDAIRMLASKTLTDELYWMAATVNSVNEEDRTCAVTAISGHAQVQLPDVRLQAEVSDGLLLIPKVNSTVFVAYTRANEPYICLFSDVDRVLLVVGQSMVEITNDGKIQLNDGSYGGLIIIDQLVTKLNALENLVNDLIAKYNTHTHQGVQTGAGTSAPTLSIETGTLTATERTDLENSQITHGQ